jgi:exo-beta-1,3-glucanase (GH17 family)
VRFIMVFALALVVAPALAIDPSEQRPLRIVDADGVWRGVGVCYGAHRDGQSPDGLQPTEANILEDLRILDPHFDVVRTYATGQSERYICELIREHDLGLELMLGVWVAPEHELDEQRNIGSPIPENIAANNEQVAAAIELANEYPEIIRGLLVGNETQIFWSVHPVDAGTLAKRIRQVRDAVSQPVSTADVFDWWYAPESSTVAAECDFVGLHAYAMWNGVQLAEAMSWTREQIDRVRERHPDLPIYICELGWATSIWTEGEEAQWIKGVPGEDEQELFYRAWRSWADGQRLPYLWFSAFDENWKNPEHPAAVENHWGLWRSNREPKKAIESGPMVHPDERMTTRD